MMRMRPHLGIISDNIYFRGKKKKKYQIHLCHLFDSPVPETIPADKRQNIALKFSFFWSLKVSLLPNSSKKIDFIAENLISDLKSKFQKPLALKLQSYLSK